jgi:glycosyltransferase involved in cell wall biosynthesis
MIAKVSACIIAKNEEDNLPRLFESIKGKFDEIVLVDTGSTDKTVEIAKSYGAKVFYREWNGFADARQYAVEKAIGEWIWFFDADCELEEDEHERFKRILLLVHENPVIEGIGVIYKNTDINGQVKGYSSTVHIHRKKPELVWEGKIHERIVNKNTGTIIIPPFSVYVLHHGYADLKTQLYKAKRNLKLIFEELRRLKPNQKEYYMNIFYVLQSYLILSIDKNGEKYLKKSLKYVNKFLENKDIFECYSKFKIHFYVYASQIYRRLNKTDQAIELLDEGLKLQEFYPDFHYLKYEIYKEKKETEKVIEEGIKFLQCVDSYGNKVITDYISMKDNVLNELVDMINLKENKDKIIQQIKEIYKKHRGLYISRLLFYLIKDKSRKEAEKIILKSAILYKSDQAYADIGLLTLENNELEKTKEYFIKALDINPFNIQANRSLYEISIKENKLKEAFEYLKNYVLYSKDDKYLPNLIEVSDKLGFFEFSKKLKERLKNF